jgi:predicted aldo/keto reductase-like oxidoreductase
LEAKAAGKIGHIGVTLHYADLFKLAVDYDWVETIMFPYNVVETQGEAYIKKCAEKGIGFIDMKPLAGGAIDDARLALRYCCSNDDVTVVIPGMADPRELEENLAACTDTAPLSSGEQEKIDAVRAQLGTVFCRRCNYCAPCAAGISVLDIFLAESYWTRYGLEEFARRKYNGMAKHGSDCIGCGVCETRCPYHLPIRDMMKKVTKMFGK